MAQGSIRGAASFFIAQELEERERIVREKEALISARDGLELKKLQCGQYVAQQMEQVAVQMKALGGHSPQGRAGRAGRSKGEKIEQLSRERCSFFKNLWYSCSCGVE